MLILPAELPKRIQKKNSISGCIKEVEHFQSAAAGDCSRIWSEQQSAPIYYPKPSSY